MQKRRNEMKKMYLVKSKYPAPGHEFVILTEGRAPAMMGEGATPKEAIEDFYNLIEWARNERHNNKYPADYDIIDDDGVTKDFYGLNL